MPNPWRRYTLAGLNLFLSLNAIYGAVWVVPGLPDAWLTGTAFVDDTVPALPLGIMLGWVPSCPPPCSCSGPCGAPSRRG